MFCWCWRTTAGAFCFLVSPLVRPLNVPPSNCARPFPWETAPPYLLRDRDRIFGEQVKAMGIKQVLSAPRSPWQRAYIERLIGTIGRECPDHVIVFSEADLSRYLPKIPRLLSLESNARGIAEGYARATASPTTRSGADRGDHHGGWAPSSV
jgi:transposase InsO family protein